MARGGPLLLLAIVGCAAAKKRANLCFAGKSTLECTAPLIDGPIDVYSADIVAQKARKLYFKGGKLCAERKCKKCMSPGAAWAPCASSATWPVRVMGANGDFATPKAVAFAVALVMLPAAMFALLRKPAAKAPAAHNGNGNGQSKSLAGRLVDYLLRFASAPWFPLVAAFGTAVNMFTIIFTGPTVVIFLAAVLGARRRWPLASLANAAGATLGTAVLLLLVREKGLDYLNDTFPVVLASPAWAKATGLMQTYGVGGMLLVSAMPIILHPVIAFGMLSGMSNTTILTIVMAGRTLKYLVMGWVTANAPGALRFFGIKGSLVEHAAAATATAER